MGGTGGEQRLNVIKTCDPTPTRQLVDRLHLDIFYSGHTHNFRHIFTLIETKRDMTRDFNNSISLNVAIDALIFSYSDLKPSSAE